MSASVVTGNDLTDQWLVLPSCLASDGESLIPSRQAVTDDKSFRDTPAVQPAGIESETRHER
jgi:hypothetical protein